MRSLTAAPEARRVLASDPAAAIDEAEAGPRLLSAIKGALELGAASGH